MGTSSGNVTFPSEILLNVSSRVADLNGVVPYAISYMKMPSSHQSTEPEWPVPFKTSGERYSSVPTKEFVNVNGSAISMGLEPFFGSRGGLSDFFDDACSTARAPAIQDGFPG